MIRSFTETEKTILLVAPELCNHLLIAGFPQNTSFSWRIYHDEIKVHAGAFDDDNYYSDGLRHQEFINPPELVVPAYTIKDVERCLPAGYFFTYTESGDYEISLSNAYSIDTCQARRLPDTFAKMVLLALRKRVIDINKLKKTLYNSKA